MPSYIDPKTGKRVTTTARVPKTPRRPGVKEPPPNAGSYKNAEGKWVTLRRHRTDAPDDPLNAERGIAQEPSQHVYWRNLRKKKTEQEEE